MKLRFRRTRASAINNITKQRIPNILKLFIIIDKFSFYSLRISVLFCKLIGRSDESLGVESAARGSTDAVPEKN